MRVLKNDDYKLLEKLVSLNQKELHKTLAVYLQSKYSKVLVTKHYIVAIGNIPIGLVAHMDTVFPIPVKDLYYDSRKGVLWSPEGLGADDRAGIFAILQIIKSGLRPSVILTTDEEKGGVGASILSKIKCPIPDLRYLIQLDRRGTNDCVFYDCYNPVFTKYVEGFGFVERYGSFTDISFLCPEWGIAGVNLSVGYEDEHSSVETLHIAPLFDTINKVKKMLVETDIPYFIYDELPNKQKWRYIGAGDDYEVYGAHCCNCGTMYSEYELFPTKGRNGIVKYYCTDCVVGNVDWCDVCGEPYEVFESAANQKLCKDCKDAAEAKNGIRENSRAI